MLNLNHLPTHLLRGLFAITLSALVLGFAAPQDPRPFPDTDPNPEPGDKLPALVTRVEPVYPAQLNEQRVEGDVWVALVVNTKGEPVKVRAFFGPHGELEKAAEAAVKQWKFTPGIACGGRVVNTQMVVQIHFSQPPAI